MNLYMHGRSYGVVLWEITSYGESPLDDMEAKDIVEAAQNGVLQHSRSELLNKGVKYIYACVYS